MFGQLIKRKRYFLIILLILTGFFLLYIKVYVAPQIFGKSVRKIQTTQKVIALTFDDGPNPDVTNEILLLLAKYNAKATFFVIGENVKKYPKIIEQIYQNGNEVGNHSWDHSKLLFKDMEFIKNQIDLTDAIIKDTGYEGNIHFRAPYGSKFLILPYVLSSMNRAHILWNIQLNDWANPSPTPEKMMKKFESELESGSIILLHDGTLSTNRKNTIRVVEMILKKYTKAGYKFLTITELLSYQNL